MDAIDAGTGGSAVDPRGKSGESSAILQTPNPNDRHDQSQQAAQIAGVKDVHGESLIGLDGLYTRVRILLQQLGINRRVAEQCLQGLLPPNSQDLLPDI